MDVGRLKELCQRLDQLAAILEIMECDPINADLHREASSALSQAISEIERLRSDDQRRETSNALTDALAEIERLRSDAADLHQNTQFDRGLSNLAPASIATDWSMKFLERKQALIGKNVRDRKSEAE